MGWTIIVEAVDEKHAHWATAGPKGEPAFPIASPPEGLLAGAYITTVNKNGDGTFAPDVSVKGPTYTCWKQPDGQIVGYLPDVFDTGAVDPVLEKSGAVSVSDRVSGFVPEVVVVTDPHGFRWRAQQDLGAKATQFNGTAATQEQALADAQAYAKATVAAQAATKTQQDNDPNKPVTLLLDDNADAITSAVTVLVGESRIDVAG